MTVTQQSFILIDESSDRIILNDQLEEILREKMQPILWFRDGLFCVIKNSVLENALATIDIMKKGFGTHHHIYIHWVQGWNIDYMGGISLSGLE